MADKQEAEAGGEALTPEEEAFFASEGEKEVEQKDEPNAEVQASEEAQASEEVGAKTKEEQEEEGDGAPARDEKGRFVPHQALHAEREEHKKTRAEMQELREFKARMEERWRLFEQSQQAPEEEPPPDPNEDIFAYSKWQAQRLENLESKLSEREKQEQTHREQTEQEQRIWNHWETDARNYSQSNPDFPNAAKWLSEYRDKQLLSFSKMDSRFASPAARNAQIEAELKGIVVQAAQRGISPAEQVYEIAQGFGYEPQKQQQEEEQGQETQSDGVSEKLERLEKAQNATRTVGQAAGKSGGDEITPETLLSMPENEFNAWMSKPENARRFEKMMGG